MTNIYFHAQIGIIVITYFPSGFKIAAFIKIPVIHVMFLWTAIRKSAWENV